MIQSFAEQNEKTSATDISTDDRSFVTSVMNLQNAKLSYFFGVICFILTIILIMSDTTEVVKTFTIFLRDESSFLSIILPLTTCVVIFSGIIAFSFVNSGSHFFPSISQMCSFMYYDTTFLALSIAVLVQFIQKLGYFTASFWVPASSLRDVDLILHKAMSALQIIGIYFVQFALFRMDFERILLSERWLTSCQIFGLIHYIGSICLYTQSWAYDNGVMSTLGMFCSILALPSMILNMSIGARYAYLIFYDLPMLQEKYSVARIKFMSLLSVSLALPSILLIVYRLVFLCSIVPWSPMIAANVVYITLNATMHLIYGALGIMLVFLYPYNESWDQNSRDQCSMETITSVGDLSAAVTEANNNLTTFWQHEDDSESAGRANLFSNVISFPSHDHSLPLPLLLVHPLNINIDDSCVYAISTALTAGDEDDECASSCSSNFDKSSMITICGHPQCDLFRRVRQDYSIECLWMDFEGGIHTALPEASTTAHEFL